MGFTSRTLRKAALKTFQYVLVAQGEPANVGLFGGIYDHFALAILKAAKQGDAKELKLLFKELYHCMRVISENEQPEHRAIFPNEAKLGTFGAVMKGALAVVSTRKQEQAEVIREKEENG